MKMENQTCRIKPADRLASVSEYYFSKKLKEVAQMNAEGMDVISLGIGSPDMPPSEKTIRTLCEAACNPDGHGYMPYVGIPELRRGFADWYQKWYGVALNPNTEIQPLIGSKEGILHVTLAFVNPGEQVLVPNPGYPTYTSLSKILGAEVVNYNLKEENGWMPDFDELERMDMSRVKLIQFAESLGGTETLITYPITQTHADLSKEELDRNGITDRILRLSVGIEGAEDLIADLEAVLK